VFRQEVLDEALLRLQSAGRLIPFKNGTASKRPSIALTSMNQDSIGETEEPAAKDLEMFFEEVDNLRYEFHDVREQLKTLKETDMPKFIRDMQIKVEEALVLSESKIRHHAIKTIEKNIKPFKEDLHKLAPLATANEQI